jgi:hypothetical protein
METKSLGVQNLRQHLIKIIMNKDQFLLNAFSLQMLPDFPCQVAFEELHGIEADSIIMQAQQGIIKSAIGHQDTANVLGVPMNRINVSLVKGDVAFVAQLQGGRLPEGATTLPEGFTFRIMKVTIL